MLGACWVLCCASGCRKYKDVGGYALSGGEAAGSYSLIKVKTLASGVQDWMKVRVDCPEDKDSELEERGRQF